MAVTALTPGPRAHGRRGGRVLAPAVASCLAAAISLAACGSSGGDGSPAGADASSAATAKTVHVGVLQLASATVIDQTVAAFEQELKTKLAPRPVSFDVKNAQGDQSLISSISRGFAQSDSDGVAVIGTPAVVALAQQTEDKPIFALAMGDPVGAKVAESLDRPGKNVTGSVDYVDPAVLLQSIMKIAPAPKRIGTIYDPSNQNMQVWIKALRAAVAKYPGVSVVESTISGAQDVPSAARSLTGRVDAELIGPDATVLSALPVVGSAAAGGKLPVYVVGGDATVAGILASIGPDYPTLGRLAADAAAKVLTGTPAAEVAFGQPSGVGFTVQKATMTKLGITLPADLLSAATVQ
ncbi:ABC transporter substrate-binding protein [Frankia gtarii]|uniref:ABC transporter substrate-binding protein n=1 Tax=Frankia gtarii TaxID=2950102 RepID=UPI0021C02A83|nr:ABC transporter substrate-binding protein [Frankia gtarii]